MKVLFVCRGNVGRSQIAKAFFNKYSIDSDASSAGTHVRENNGQRISDIKEAEFVCMAMDKEGIDVREFQRRQLNKEDLANFDRIIVMTNEDLPGYLMHNPKVIFWNIENPKGKDYESTAKTRDLIKEKVKDLIKETEK